MCLNCFSWSLRQIFSPFQYIVKTLCVSNACVNNISLHIPTANVVLLSAFPPHNTTLSIDVFPLGNRAMAGEILGDEHLLSSDHLFEVLSYTQESSEGHGPPVP